MTDSVVVGVIPHCNYFVERKKRFCKMTVKSGEEFCGEHRKTEEIPNNDEDKNKIRILCPLSGKHTCYAHNLKKHLKICNAREPPAEPFISKGINSGKETHNGDITDSSYKLLSTFSVDQMKVTISKVKELYKSLVNDRITEKILKHDLVEEEMLKPEYGDKKKKHLKQASSILAMLESYNLMKPNTCYIEFGAGRGQLGFWIAKATESFDQTSLLLVERASPKHKRDNKLAKTTDEVRRVRADIADLVIDKLDIISKADNIVGVTKHLCGEATDLALRCLTNSKGDKVKGALLTFCCHHRCRWIPYTGKDFFKENNLTKNDFDIMCGMTSWATCGTGLSRELRNKEGGGATAIDLKQNERDAQMQLTKKEKEEIGRQSKNILNWGRLTFMEKNNFKCNLHYYVEPVISLENVCIVAYK